MKVFISFLFLVIISSSSFSQVISSDSSANSHYIFDVYVIHEYELGYQFYERDNSSIRLSLGVYITSNDSESNRDREYTDQETLIQKSNNDSEYYNHDISLRAQYLYRFYKSELGAAYFGIGPIFGYYIRSSNSKSYYEDKTNLNGNTEYETSSKGKGSDSRDAIRLGLTGLIGIRSYLTKSLSFFAESHINFYKSWLTGKNNNEHYDYSDDGNTWHTDHTESYDENILSYDFTYIRVGLRFNI